MKKVMFIPIAMLLFFTACKKEKTDEVSEEDATEVLTKSMETDNSGLPEQLKESVEMAEKYVSNPICGMQDDTSIVKSYNSATRSLDYTFNWSWIVNCSGSQPSDITFDYTSSGEYDAPRVKSTDNATGQIVLTQLLATETEYSAEINYTRNGSQDSKVGQNTSFTSTVTASGSGITIDKTSYEITGGTISVSISGSSSSGIAFSYSGNLVFNGAGSATITLANGNVYQVSI